jgi:carbamoyltransferase
MMHTLGINAAFHDPAACLASDGRVVAAAEEERFTHIKHGKRPVPFSTWELPFHAIDFCLRQAGLSIKEIHHVAYSFDPYLLLPQHYTESVPIPAKVGKQAPPEGFDTTWDPLFLASIAHAPGHLCDGWPHHLQTRLRGVCAGGMPFRWHWVPHHTAHAASAFHASPFPRAAIMTLDGRGEKATTGYAVGEGNQLKWLGQVEMPHSLGLLYEAVTGYLGFLHSSDEYKVMALASYGKPNFLRDFRDIVKVGEKGQYTIGEMKLEERFGPPRPRGGEIEQKHYDLAASLQVVLEETVLELARSLHEETKESDLCLAGGVALNCVMNARLRDDGPFNRIWVQPAAGDAGTALGAALWVDAQERGIKDRSYTMCHAYLGPAFNDVEIEEFLTWTKVPFRHLKNIAEETADILVKDKIIGWFQGRMEFGPTCRSASTKSRTARISAPWPQSYWRKRRPTGSSARASRPSCFSSTRSCRTRPSAFRRFATWTARPASKPSIIISVRAITIFLRRFRRAPAFRCWSTRRSTRAASRSSARRAMRWSASGPRRWTPW